MPFVRHYRGRRVTPKQRRDGWVGVRLAAVPQDDLSFQWVRLTPEAYRAKRTCVYQPAVVHVVLPGGRR